jgi:energy-coupling factor transporter ATP-binding protein EcfA2
MSKIKCTFESFDLGPDGDNNVFAYSAALVTAEKPGMGYNPLLLYGGSGSGKTHLLQAIREFVLRKKPGKHVAYLPAEAFTGEFIAAVQNNQIEEFRNKYGRMAVLLIDDIQCLVGRERIQEELYHTFNRLQQGGTQIVLASNCSPRGMECLTQRLVSRFDWGLMTDLRKPRTRTKAKNKAAGVSGRSKPASKGRMKTSHFEGRVASCAADAAQGRDESTQREPATFDNDLGSPWLVAPADRARTGPQPRDGAPVSAAGGFKTGHFDLRLGS